MKSIVTRSMLKISQYRFTDIEAVKLIKHDTWATCKVTVVILIGHINWTILQ